MSTHATLAYKKGDDYVCKDVHYGYFNDVSFYLKNATAEDIIKSVDAGDSSSVFAGFYANEAYCKKHLNWSYEQAGVKPDSFKPKCVTKDELFGLNEHTYVLVDDIVEIYEEGKCVMAFMLKDGDGKGAIRNRIAWLTVRQGIGYWVNDTCFKFIAFGAEDVNELRLIVLDGNGKARKFKFEEEIDLDEFTKDMMP